MSDMYNELMDLLLTDDPECIKVCEIDLSETEEVLINEKTAIKSVDLKGAAGACQIDVFTNEGDYLPHFHITNKKGLDCCVRIDTAEFFAHGNHKDTLNSKSMKVLDQKLREKCEKSESGQTNWEYIRDLYFGNERKVEKPEKQPDYTKTKGK